MGGHTCIRDSYHRKLSYLRVSVTDRCNLNCLYCRRWYFSRYFPAHEILTYEELLRLVKIGGQLGISKIRITGGEPFVRKDVCRFIKKVVRVPGIKDVSVTTNGLLLHKYLSQLQEAGVCRLNISLDTLSRDKYKLITGRDAFDKVWHAILAALEAGFAPVKINMVVMRGINDEEVVQFADLTRHYPLHVRFIEYMPSSKYRLDHNRQVMAPVIKERLSREGGFRLYPVVPADNSNVAELFRYKDGLGEVGFISPISKHFCHTCNRLRLTADGQLRPCLLSDVAVPVKPSLRDGSSNIKIASLLRKAASVKPKSGFGNSRDSSAGASGDNFGEHESDIPELMSAIGG
ncbi:MAG: GTP 3',8-cyclase MoaA [Desulfosudaceae bacterium]